MKKFGVSAFEKNKIKHTIKEFEQQNDELDQQLKAFQEKLIEFARLHNDEIRSNPEFRSKFMIMCNNIGIDPLNLFIDRDKHLFTVNDFNYEMCLRIIQICRNTKDINGGLIPVSELQNVYFKKWKITEKQLLEIIDMLRTLDGGFEIIEIKNQKILRSIPNELTNDQTKILECCSILGYVSNCILKANLNWNKIRRTSALNEMVTNGLLWVDQQDIETLYWDPSWINKTYSFEQNF